MKFNQIISALALLCLAPILSSCGEADAARNKSPTKVCPGGVIVRANQKCPTTTPTPPPPAPYFTATGDVVNENGGAVVIHITKVGTTTSSSTVAYSTGAVGDTATAGSDYTATSGTLTFAADETDKTIAVPITNDSTWEPTETFSVKIVAVTNALINIGTATVTILDDDPAPIQTPPSPTEPVVSPNGTAGETDIADNFTTSTTLITTTETVPTSLDPVGAFRFSCLGGQLLRDDPIVYPGQPGKSHLHQFFGNTLADGNSTYNSLRTTGGSTCTRDSSNNPLSPTPQRTAYWMPAILDGAGNAVKADTMLTYYKELPVSNPACGAAPDATHIGYCVPLPNGIRFIQGYNMANHLGGPTDTNSMDFWKMGFDCYSKAVGGPGSLTGTKATIAAIVATGLCPAGSWLRVFITFPDCWDGVNLDTADHRSHMAYGDGALIQSFKRACPADHPYNIPEIALQAFFTTDANFVSGKWHLASDEMIPGIAAGTTLHADYWEAWSPVVKGDWQTGCIDGHLSCNVGELGNGHTVDGMAQVAPYPNHILVPLTSIP